MRVRVVHCRRLVEAHILALTIRLFGAEGFHTTCHKHDAVHLQIDKSGRATYPKLKAAITRVESRVNEALGLGAHFVLEETRGFYAHTAYASDAQPLFEDAFDEEELDDSSDIVLDDDESGNGRT